MLSWAGPGPVPVSSATTRALAQPAAFQVNSADPLEASIVARMRVKAKVTKVLRKSAGGIRRFSFHTLSRSERRVAGADEGEINSIGAVGDEHYE
jgi:hypothetical protein